MADLVLTKGRRYVLRNGWKTEPLEEMASTIYPWTARAFGSAPGQLTGWISWTEDGRYQAVDEEDDLDIIVEVA